MALRVLKRVGCLIGIHERARNMVRKTPAGKWRSVCAQCGVPMERRSKGRWSAQR